MWRAMVLLTLTLVMFLAACGADDDGPTDGSQNSSPISTNGPTATNGDQTSDSAETSPDPDPTDGRLTTKSGEVITDFGDRDDREAAVQTLNQLQEEFRAGRMAAACTKISDFLLSQFTPPGTEDQTPCPKKLEAYAAARARRGDPPQRLQLLWVRSYPGESGVWADDAQGRRIRIQLSNVDGKGLKLDLGALGRPDLLAAELIGADAYSGR